MPKSRANFYIRPGAEMRPVFAGEVYQEVDTRFKRWVRVLSVHNGAVIIGTCHENGARMGTRQTTCKQERFNGKHGGYRYCFSLGGLESNPQVNDSTKGE